MPGNAGLSFGFTVAAAEAGSRYVIRLAPPGVRKQGNTDVLRQVPLLDALSAAAIPVARVVFSTADPAWFGTDAMIQEFVSGLPLHMHHADSSVAADDPLPLVGAAVDVLAAVHRLPWTEVLPDWETPRDHEAEIDFWLPLMRRAGDEADRDSAEQLVARLKQTRPHDIPTGIMHGDYQTNNVLYHPSGQVLAVVDWELAGIGPQLLDLGWLSMMTDPQAWAPDYAARLRVLAPPAWLRERYEAAAGLTVAGYDWYRALACYRFASIVAFNLRLHRTGRRVDPWYENLASSIATLLSYGSELLA
jgi:aminoglycoside phosphotransferase (APT) family kinase protein